MSLVKRSKTPKMLVVYTREMAQHKNNIGERAVMELEPARRLLKLGFVEVVAGPLTDEEVAEAGGIRAWLEKNKAKKVITEKEFARLPKHPHIPEAQDNSATAKWEVPKVEFKV